MDSSFCSFCWLSQLKLALTRAPLRGIFCPSPLSNIRYNLTNTQDIATKLSVPYRTSIWHLVWNFVKFDRKNFEKMTFQWRHVMRFWAKSGRQLYRSQINVYWSKSQTKGVKRSEIEFSTRWLSRIFKMFWILTPKMSKKHVFLGKVL